MLIASLLEPSQGGGPGDFWYCLANQDLYEYFQPNPVTFCPTWTPVGPGRYASTNPPPVHTKTGRPIDPIWIDMNDPNRIPRIWDSSGNWIPVVAASFAFPPQSPNAGDIWTNINTMTTYSFDGTQWIDVTAPATLKFTTQPTPAPLFTITAASQLKPSALRISGLIEIYMDGTIIYDASYTPDKAAEALWEAIAHFSPLYKEGEEVKQLRELLEFARQQGFKIPQPKKPGDPNAAWDEAMGVVI